MQCCRKSDQARKANEEMSLDAERVHPVVNAAGKIHPCCPSTISDQLQLSCERVTKKNMSVLMHFTHREFLQANRWTLS
jgi:hypothetical protein